MTLEWLNEINDSFSLICSEAARKFKLAW